MAASFATADELRSLLDGAVLTDARANLILGMVSDDIRAGVGWAVTEELAAVFTLDGNGESELFLPTRHVTAVTSVVEDGTTLTTGTQFAWIENGILTRLNGGFTIFKNWTSKTRAVVATINHGYAAGAVPGIFRTVCLDYAALMVANPVGLRTLQTGSVAQTTDASAVLGAVKAGDDPRLDRYRVLR